MAFDENPDEVFDNEPDSDLGGNSDEQSNRSFRMLMIGLFALGGLGVLLIALIFINRQGASSAIEIENQMRQATNDAVAALARTSPTPFPTDTPVPTNTALPTNTPTVAPSPTRTPTLAPVIDGTTVVTGTGVVTSTTAGGGTAIARVQGTAAANATRPAGAAPTAVAGRATVTLSPKEATAAASKVVTGTKPITGTAGTGSTGLPTTGASDNLVMWLLAAVGLVGVLVVARRLRTAQS